MPDRALQKSASKVTALDVAKRAGVSQPTVSRVFTPGTEVSEPLARKVRDAAQELGYRPNTLARAMITGQSKTIGLVVAYLDNPFYTEALEALSRKLQTHGYNLMVIMGANDDGNADDVVQNMLDHQVDGIIMASVSISSALTERLTAQNLPLILFNRGQDGTTLSSVTSANIAGGRKVAEFLIAGGHRKIAHISGWQGAMTGRDRQAGFLAGLTAAGLAPHAIIDGMYDRDIAARAAHHLLDGPHPDAIFVGNDHMAFAVLEVLRARGARVPGDISVVGYDDVTMAAWPSFALTTVRQPATRMIEATVTQLLAEITRGHAPRQIEIDGDLMIRNTARIPTHILKGSP